MAYVPPAGVTGPYRDDNAQFLLFKIATYLAGVVTGYWALSTKSPVSSTVTRAGFTSGLTSSQTLLAANSSRVYFTVDNRTGKDAFLRFGSAAATTAVGGYDLRIPSGFSVSEETWKGEVTFICDTGAAATGVNVSEASS